MEKALFSRQEPDFARFLTRVGRQKKQDFRHFVGRNFLLDEGIARARGDVYCEYLTRHERSSDFLDWLQEHSEYLQEEVFLPQPASGIPHSVDPSRPSSCPATFKEPEAFVPFGSADLELYLMRLVPLQELETAAAPLSTAKLAEVAVRAASGESEDVRLFDAILSQWATCLQLRPAFAAFWEDLKVHFGETPEQDDPDWADAIRDRLGLLHLDPPSRRPEGIPVLAFRYKVREIPRRVGMKNSRPLVVPTVLDTCFNVAFCPGPRNQRGGRTVDLSAKLEPPCREVLHPFFPFRAKHLFRFGTVRAPVPEKLEDARFAHILYLRESSTRDDFAVATDPETK